MLSSALHGNKTTHLFLHAVKLGEKVKEGHLRDAVTLNVILVTQRANTDSALHISLETKANLKQWCCREVKGQIEERRCGCFFLIFVSCQ